MRVIQHPAYEAPRRRLRRALDEQRPGHMVFVIGPSGVGKTTMRRSVMQEMFGNPACWGVVECRSSRHSRCCRMAHSSARAN